MGQVACPETSVNNYLSTLRNVPEERRSHTKELLILNQTIQQGQVLAVEFI